MKKMGKKIAIYIGMMCGALLLCTGCGFDKPKNGSADSVAEEDAAKPFEAEDDSELIYDSKTAETSETTQSFKVDEPCRFHVWEYGIYYVKAEEPRESEYPVFPNAGSQDAVYLSHVVCSEDIFSLYGEENAGYMDAEGRLLGDMIYDFVYPFSEGLGCAVLDGKYGFVDRNGQTAIPFVYSDAAPFSEGLAYFCTQEEHGFLDREGKIAFTLDCDSVSSFSEGLAYFSIDGKYGYINREGQVVIEPVYDDAGSFEGGTASVRVGGAFQMIDSSGREITEKEYSVMQAGNNGREEEEFSVPEKAVSISRSEIFNINKITPRREQYWEVTREKDIYSGEGFCYRKLFKLFSMEGMDELLLYRMEEPVRQMGFVMSNSSFYGMSNQRLEQYIAGDECGGSARGDRVCFWWDKEINQVLLGTVGAAGGFGGFSSYQTMYEIQNNQPKLREALCWIGQTAGNYSEEELLENAEMFFDEKDRPYTKETILKASEWVHEYTINDRRVTPREYEQAKGKYEEVTVLE